MNINQYKIYVKDTIDLAKSILIHSKETAETINNNLIELGHEVNLDDPRTWKYYMHLNGEYHPSDPKPFTIISKDTLKPIEFTKENIKEHPATATIYQVSSPEYNKLVALYPTLESLIRGVLSPIDYSVSIDSDNYTILDWSKTLIEENEFSLIKDIQSSIFSYFYNYNNRAFGVADNLYFAANLGIFYTFLPNIILNIRLKKCFTNETHSFHVWAYLAGYGRLDRWKDVLDIYQVHYLYRNIRYINNNAGQTLIFEDLIKVLLSKKGFPIFGYDMRQMINDMPDILQPNILATRYRIDENVKSTNFNETINVARLVEKTEECARDNYTIKKMAIEKTNNSMIKSYKDKVVTKTLETEKGIVVENKPLLLIITAYNHWVYLSCSGLFPIGITLEHRSSEIHTQMGSLEALAVYVYCGSILLNCTLETIPDINCFRVKKKELPTLEQLEKLIFSRNIDINWVKSLLSNQVVIEEVGSVKEFTELCHKLVNQDFNDRFLSSLMMCLDDNTNAKLIVDAFWANEKDIIIKEDYETFFKRMSINPKNITKENAKEIMDQIFIKVTGFDPNDLGSNWLLERLIELLMFLSSYNIQVIENDDLSKILPTNWPLIRLNILGVFVTILPFKVKIFLLNIIKEYISVTNSYLIKLFSLEKIQSSVIINNRHIVDSSVSLTERYTVTSKEKIHVSLIKVL